MVESLLWINRLSPSLGIGLAKRQFQKVQKELGIEVGGAGLKN
jgi:hypothetical protein